MNVFIPSGLPPRAPLVVVLHGCTQTAEGYDHGAGWSALAARHGFALLYPEQDRANNPNLCFNWFNPDDVTRGHGEVLSIKQMVDQTIQSHGLDPARVYINGLSAGGAMTAALLATYPETFAGGGIIAGLPYGAATGMQGAFEAMRSPRQRSAREWGDLVRAASPYRGRWPSVQIWHGGADATVGKGNLDASAQQWTNVLGLSGPPSVTQDGGVTHQIWRADNGGAVETFLISGMGHGTPLHPAAGDLDQSFSAAGPFMLEAGISSTWCMARSWGLLTQAAGRRPTRPDRGSGDAKVGGIKDGVASVIRNALRSAGLTGVGGA